MSEKFKAADLFGIDPGFAAALENYEEEPFEHLLGCPGGPLQVSFGGERSCMRCQVANAAYEQGQRDALADMDLAAYLLGKREAISEAVQRVEALYEANLGRVVYAKQVIAAITGEVE